MSAEDTKTYDFTSISVTFCGVPLDSGNGDGGIKIEKPDPDFTAKAGLDGSVVRSKTNKPLHKITLSFLQTAAANEILSLIRKKDLATKNGSGIGPLMIADTNGKSIHFFKKAWIVTVPNVEYGAEASNRDWELAGVETTNIVGGN
jgi:hypothetical protein